MRTSRLVLMVAAMLAAPLHAEPSPAEPEPGTIVVPGKREIDWAIVGDNLKALNQRIALNEVVPRFYTPLCLHVIGPDLGANRIIGERITEAATAAGLEKPKPGCRENALVIIVDEPKRLFERLVGRRHWSVGEIGRDATLRELREELNSGKPAIVWNRSSFAQNGLPAVTLPGDPAVLRTAIGSRIPGYMERPKVLSVVVFDAGLIGGATPTQLGDYAAVHLLASPRRNIDFSAVSARSILSLFASDPDIAPDSLTAFDRAYLRGVYENTGPGLRGPVTTAILAAYGAECADEKPDCQFLPQEKE
jgi:hypothetical protein